MIEVDRQNDVAVVALCHGKANLLDLESCRVLDAAFEELSRDRPRAVILTGRGRIFCAGVDLHRVLHGGVDYVREFLPALGRVFRTVFAFPAPVVAALNGHAVAGGCVLAAAADFRILADSGGRVGTPELRVGVPFPIEAMEVMRALLTPQNLRTAVLGGETFDAVTARSLGLVDEIVATTELLPSAFGAARKLASIPSVTFDMTKRQLRQRVVDVMEEGADSQRNTLLRVWSDPAVVASLHEYIARTLR